MLQDAVQSKATDGFRKGFDDTIQYRLMASKLEISFEREMREVVVVRYVHPDPAQNSPSLTSCLDPSGWEFSGFTLLDGKVVTDFPVSQGLVILLIRFKLFSDKLLLIILYSKGSLYFCPPGRIQRKINRKRFLAS